MILREIILIWYLISEPFNKVSFLELSDWDEIIASFIIRIKAGSHIDEDLHEFHFRWLKIRKIDTPLSISVRLFSNLPN